LNQTKKATSGSVSETGLKAGLKAGQKKFRFKQYTGSLTKRLPVFIFASGEAGNNRRSALQQAVQ
jgi:hypothetical protein